MGTPGSGEGELCVTLGFRGHRAPRGTSGLGGPRGPWGTSDSGDHHGPRGSSGSGGHRGPRDNGLPGNTEDTRVVGTPGIPAVTGLRGTPDSGDTGDNRLTGTPDSGEHRGQQSHGDTRLRGSPDSRHRTLCPRRVTAGSWRQRGLVPVHVPSSPSPLHPLLVPSACGSTCAPRCACARIQMCMWI